MTKKESKLLTVKEAAERLGVPPVSVRLWARQGRLAGAKLEETEIGSYWKIPEASLAGFEKSKPGPKPGSKQKTRRKG
jgi:excisionase family DNA binding protein